MYMWNCMVSTKMNTAQAGKEVYKQQELDGHGSHPTGIVRLMVPSNKALYLLVVSVEIWIVISMSICLFI